MARCGGTFTRIKKDAKIPENGRNLKRIGAIREIWQRSTWRNLAESGKIAQRFDKIWQDLAKSDKMGEWGRFCKILLGSPNFDKIGKATRFEKIWQDLARFGSARSGKNWQYFIGVGKSRDLARFGKTRLN